METNNNLQQLKNKEIVLTNLTNSLMHNLTKPTLTFQEVFHRNNINALQFQIDKADLISLIGKIEPVLYTFK